MEVRGMNSIPIVGSIMILLWMTLMISIRRIMKKKSGKRAKKTMKIMMTMMMEMIILFR